MGIINLIQGSPEWLELRKNKITGTDSSVLLGSNPFKTRLELWQQKMGLKEQDACNAAMLRELGTEKSMMESNPLISLLSCLARIP